MALLDTFSSLHLLEPINSLLEPATPSTRAACAGPLQTLTEVPDRAHNQSEPSLERRPLLSRAHLLDSAACQVLHTALALMDVQELTLKALRAGLFLLAGRRAVPRPIYALAIRARTLVRLDAECAALVRMVHLLSQIRSKDTEASHYGAVAKIVLSDILAAASFIQDFRAKNHLSEALDSEMRGFMDDVTNPESNLQQVIARLQDKLAANIQTASKELLSEYTEIGSHLFPSSTSVTVHETSSHQQKQSEKQKQQQEELSQRLLAGSDRTSLETPPQSADSAEAKLVAQENDPSARQQALLQERALRRLEWDLRRQTLIWRRMKWVTKCELNTTRMLLDSYPESASLPSDIGLALALQATVEATHSAEQSATGLNATQTAQARPAMLAALTSIAPSTEWSQAYKTVREERKPHERFEHFIRPNGLLTDEVEDLFLEVGSDHDVEVDMENKKIYLFASAEFERQLLARADAKGWPLREFVRRKHDGERTIITDFREQTSKIACGPLIPHLEKYSGVGALGCFAVALHKDNSVCLGPAKPSSYLSSSSV